jgi:uncharacterized protein YkwD
MRISNKIIFFLILLALIVFIKSDYKSVPSKILSYLQNSINKTGELYKDNVGGAMDSITGGGASKDDTKQVVTPGALKVSSDYLTNDAKSTKLTISGVINITNEYRKENGDLPPLKENSKLDFSAEKKLQDMFTKGYFEHVSPSGVGVGDLGDQVSYEYIIIGENLAMGNFKDDRSLVDAWMASPGHRANILNKRYSEIGVAVGKGQYNGKTVWMAVQHFALPKSACPSIDDVLKGIISLEQDKIKSMEADLAKRKATIESGAIREGMTTNGQIDEYNSLVNEYNKLIADIKIKINQYNTQVRDFNKCIAEEN